ncbi:retinol dehydrogenase 11-like isoform X2 [Daktulosphaira vitifoliae]|nr:retinol dehydrogenase 11-like isoform X2 [Daktulosphaira vitifoliae]XP_050534720.1 retinol dehydrogenase 11-like isoform X2 [Daktulosphaira vitifoliae]XP_050534721.1 retinol dehydrogenase 11-like isoform X2 [Daktulosphaira vitifoliae]
MACRDVKKADQALLDIKTEVQGEGLGTLIVEKLDLSSFSSIKRCAKRILERENQIHLLINNAGLMMSKKILTEDGFETQFAVNYLGHFLFTCLLLPRIIYSSPARIINVSSMSHTFFKNYDFDDINYDLKDYYPMEAYCQNKLANILFTKELATRLAGTRVNLYCLHPGNIKTEIHDGFENIIYHNHFYLWIFLVSLSFIIYLFLKTPHQGAQTTIHCAIDEKAGTETGLYYSNCQVKEPSSMAKDIILAKKLWKKSLNMVGLTNFDMFKSSDTIPTVLLDF